MLRNCELCSVCGAGERSIEGTAGVRGDTYMGESDFSESSIVILYLHFLHERTNDQVGVSAWAGGRGKKIELENVPPEDSQSWAESRSSLAKSRTHLRISGLLGCGPRFARRECDAGMALSAPTASHCWWKSQRPAENGILSPRLCPPRNCLLAEKLNHQGGTFKQNRAHFEEYFLKLSVWVA